MGFKKGDPKPAGSGRKKGQVSTGSATVKKVREIFAERGDSPATMLIDLMAELEPRDKAKVLLELLRYCEPPAPVPQGEAEPKTVVQIAGVDRMALLQAAAVHPSGPAAAPALRGELFEVRPPPGGPTGRLKHEGVAEDEEEGQ